MIDECTNVPVCEVYLPTDLKCHKFVSLEEEYCYDVTEFNV